MSVTRTVFVCHSERSEESSRMSEPMHRTRVSNWILRCAQNDRINPEAAA